MTWRVLSHFKLALSSSGTEIFFDNWNTNWIFPHPFRWHIFEKLTTKVSLFFLLYIKDFFRNKERVYTDCFEKLLFMFCIPAKNISVLFANYLSCSFYAWYWKLTVMKICLARGLLNVVFIFTTKFLNINLKTLPFQLYWRDVLQK